MIVLRARREAKRIVEAGHAKACITLTLPDEGKPPRCLPHRTDLLWVQCGDVDEGHPNAPTLEDAQRVLDFNSAFCRPLPGDQEYVYVVHCIGGIGRSPAAVMGILAQANPRITAWYILHKTAALRDPHFGDDIIWPNLALLKHFDTILGTDLRTATIEWRAEKNKQRALLDEKLKQEGDTSC